MATDRRTILLSGMMAGTPCHGGATWAVLQHVIGLRGLGHEVYFVEPLSESDLEPEGASLGESANAQYFRKVARQFGMEETAALLLTGTHETIGLPYRKLKEIAGRADILLNISGLLSDPDLFDPIEARVYLDLDPGFTQLWHAVEGIDLRFAGHTHFFTVGGAIGREGCCIPACGLRWAGTCPPVVLDEWPVADTTTYDAFTTVANWRGYGSIEHEGTFYGQKAHSLRRLMELPLRTRESFILALAIHPEETGDLDALAANGWRLINPALVSGSPSSYRRFIRGSKAEFGLTKSGYVAARTGWFSDRSACYLAAGRPVVAQATGFDDYLPAGEGLFAFETVDEAMSAIEEVNRDYSRHARAARHIAEEYLDADKVLRRLLDKIEALPCQ